MANSYNFYSSKGSYFVGLKQKIVSTNNGFFDDTRNFAEYRLYYKNRIVIGYEDTWKVFKLVVGGNYKKHIIIYIGKELSELLHKLDAITFCCTKGSISIVFKNSKALGDYLWDNSYYDKDLNFKANLQHDWIHHTITFDVISNDKWLSEKDAKLYFTYFADFADKLIYDLVHIKSFYLAPLEYKSKEEIERESRRYPSWVNDVIKGGIKVGVALLGGAVLSNIPIPDLNNSIPDLDLDGDFDINSDGIIDSNVDVDVDADLSNIDASHDYSTISFMGAPNDGTYTITGQTVSVRSDSGNMYNDIKVYLHNGKKYIDFKNHWFEMSGSGFFSFLGNGYKIIH